ncbi:MAG: Rrf2 family transcriptional regulator [Rickettsiales bacterium]|nr:Rrf2 family transcriptional regulator [Rickettsiales bacterium]
MILTTKGRYAVMAMIDLLDETNAENDCKPVSLLSISQRQSISLSYLEQIFANLRKAEIVRSIKGPGGGYALQKAPQKITISEIIAATGESIRMTNCGDKKEGCAMARTHTKSRCRTHDLWHGLEKNIYNYLSAISLHDFCKKK